MSCNMNKGVRIAVILPSPVFHKAKLDDHKLKQQLVVTKGKGLEGKCVRKCPFGKTEIPPLVIIMFVKNSDCFPNLARPADV